MNKTISENEEKNLLECPSQNISKDRQKQLKRNIPEIWYKSADLAKIFVFLKDYCDKIKSSQTKFFIHNFNDAKSWILFEIYIWNIKNMFSLKFLNGSSPNS